LKLILAISLLGQLLSIVLLRAIADEGDSNEIRFLVADVSKPQMLPSVDVTLVGPKGVRQLGETDNQGTVLISRSVLREAGTKAVVVFCLEWFYCGAFRLDEPAFFDYEERYIALAPYQVR
jgi:hypothetical protein